MNAQQIMTQLEALGKERTKKIYMRNGATEPLFGVATGAMKPIFKEVGINQALAEQLYATKNYDAMYFAGIIADPLAMTAADFNRWMEDAYFYMISDYIVAVTLSEAPIAKEVADRWIDSGEDLYMSAGWSTYCWLLGQQKDETFSTDKLRAMIDDVQQQIHTAPPRTQISMNRFLAAVAILYAPLHTYAYNVAKEIGSVTVNEQKKTMITAVPEIETAIEKGRIGFKRRHVRC